MDPHFLWLAFVVFVANTVQAMTGFGSVIIAVTLGSRFYPIEILLPILVPMDILLNSYIAARYRAHVDGQVLFRRILPLMGLGLVVGIGVFQFVQGEALRRSFGLLVTLLSGREIFRLLRGSGAGGTISRLKYSLYVWAAGLVQGVFASGGPLVVYALSWMRLPKARFRATLAALWLLTNTTLTVSYVVTGRFTLESARTIATLLPLLAAGMIAGEKLHDRVDERGFRIAVFAILTIAGVSILVA